jgi:hypothetical protein
MKKIENNIKKNSKFEDLKNAEVEALSDFSDQIGELMKSMDEYRVFLDRDDIRKFDKTYKNLGYFWEKIQNQLIYLWDVDERGETK